MEVPEFLEASHEEHFYDLLIEDGSHPGDVERMALFYLIAGNRDLYQKRTSIYDFKEHSIRKCLEKEEVDFSSGMKSLIRLGFNLYNGYMDKQTSPVSLFYNLDEDNKELAMNAIKIRFL